jgi:hypothetical protein
MRVFDDVHHHVTCIVYADIKLMNTIVQDVLVDHQFPALEDIQMLMVDLHLSNHIYCIDQY